MSSQVRWLIVTLVFIAGLLLGFVGSVLLPDLGLVALYERVGIWTLLVWVVLGLLLVFVPVSYAAWLILGTRELTSARRRAGPSAALHYGGEGAEATEIRRVLVPTAGGPHAVLGMHLAAQIARAGDGSVTLFRVITPREEVDTEAQTQALGRMAESVIGEGVPIETRVSRSPSVVDAILEETSRGKYDLLVVGASDEGTVRGLLFGTIPGAVAGQTPCPVLIVRAARGDAGGEE